MAAAPNAAARRVTYVVGQDVTTLEPTGVSGWTDHTATLAIFGALTFNFDGGTGEVGYRPFLAERIEPKDSHMWEVRLRPGLTFHDGKRVDAEALAFSFRRVLHPEFPSKRFFHNAPIERVEVVDDLTARFHTSEPIAILPARLLRADGYLVSPRAYRDTPPWELERTAFQPIGAGPFAFEHHDPGERLVLRVYEGFRDPRGYPRPNFDQLELRVIDDAGAALEALAAGEVDIVPILADAVASADSIEGVRTVSAPDTSRLSFEFNQRAHPALADRRVRRALLHAIDVDALLEAHTGGAGVRLTTLVNPPNVDPELRPFEHDPAKARSLLAEAGWEDGFELDIEWSTTPDRGVVASSLVPYLEAVGVRVGAVRELDWSSEYLPRQIAGTLAGIHGHGHGGVEMTVETDLWPHHPERDANSMGWTGPEADRFVERYAQLQREVDPDAQRRLGFELQRIAHDEAISIVLWQTPRYVALGPRIERYRPYPGGHNEDFWTVGLR